MRFPVLLKSLFHSLSRLRIGRRRTPSPPASPEAAAWLHSPVSRQHWRIGRGARLDASALREARHQLEARLQRDAVEGVAHSLPVGPAFLVQVQALAQIGTEAAASVLERQVHRTLSQDPIENCWYAIDLACGLRRLGRDEVLPTLLRRSRALLPLPMGHLFAAEVVSFPGFARHLDYPLASLGQAALRTLVVALRAIRLGQLPAGLFAEADLGATLRRLVRACPGSADALVTLAFLELLRLRRRALVLAVGRPEVREQLARLEELEAVVREYLHNIGEDLARAYDHASCQEQGEILGALDALRCDVGGALLARLQRGPGEHRLAMLRCLRWSPAAEVRDYLLGQLRELRGRCNAGWWRRWDRDPELGESHLREHEALLRGLVGQPDAHSEQALLEAALEGPARLRVVAIEGLGWWEPLRRTEVLNALHVARMDADAAVRTAATVALARLGGVVALQRVREALQSPQAELLHSAIEWVAEGGVSWLWCELDELTEHADPGVAAHACDGLERLRERLFGPLGA